MCLLSSSQFVCFPIRKAMLHMPSDSSILLSISSQLYEASRCTIHLRWIFLTLWRHFILAMTRKECNLLSNIFPSDSQVICTDLHWQPINRNKTRQMWIQILQRGFSGSKSKITKLDLAQLMRLICDTKTKADAKLVKNLCKNFSLVEARQFDPILNGSNQGCANQSRSRPMLGVEFKIAED